MLAAVVVLQEMVCMTQRQTTVIVVGTDVTDRGRCLRGSVTDSCVCAFVAQRGSGERQRGKCL